MFFDDEANEWENIYWTPTMKAGAGSYSPHNLDTNYTFFNILNDRTYARWRFHFFIILCLCLLISKIYPSFFIIVIIDIIMFMAWNQSDLEYISEDYFYDYKYYISHINGGDVRLNLYVFIFK